MKKFLFSTLLCSSILIQAFPLDDLEQAIQNSDLKRVRVILPKVQLSEQDKNRLVYLAHDVLCSRRNKCDIYTMNPYMEMPDMEVSDVDTAEAHLIVWLGLISFVGGGFMMVSNQERKKIGKILCAGGFMVMIAGTMYVHRERYRKLNELYTNALKIKQLMLQI